MFSLFVLFTSSKAAEVTFILTVEAAMPEGEVVCLEYNYHATVDPMTKTGENEWQITIDGFNIGEDATYLYKRNYNTEGEWEDRPKGIRNLDVSSETITVHDTIRKWRWWPADGVVPAIDMSGYLTSAPTIMPKRKFYGGVFLIDYWSSIRYKPLVVPTMNVIKDRYGTGTSVIYNTLIHYDPSNMDTSIELVLLDLDSGGGGTSDEDLIYLITETHNRGLKFVMYFCTFPSGNETSINGHHPAALIFTYAYGQAWWESYFEQLTPFVLNYAQIAEQNNVEMFLLKNQWHQDDSEFVAPLYAALIDEIKNVYSGPIALDQWGGGGENHMAAFDKADYIAIDVFSHDMADHQQHISDLNSPDIDELCTEIGHFLDFEYKLTTEEYDKPVIVYTLGGSSYDGALLGEPYWEDVFWYYPDDPAAPVNLQVQADFFEASMQAIAERPWIEGVFSFGYVYWDNLDKSVSVRGKPAEGVLAKWVDWMSESSLSKRPAVLSYSTNSATAGTAITITGDNFNSATEVLFGDVSADFAIVSNTEMDVIVPENLPYSNTVTVYNSQGGASSIDKFYVPPFQSDRSHLLKFNYSNAMTIPSNNLAPSESFTFETWIHIDSVAEFDQLMNLQYGEWPTGMSFYFYASQYSDKNPDIGFSQHNQQSEEGATIQHSFWPGMNKWAHAAGVYNNDSLFFYLDFAEVKTSGWNENKSKPAIGSPPAGVAQISLGSFFGKIRDVRLWNKALSPEEMLAYAEQPPDGTEEDLVAYWPLDDGSGQTARDIGPNNLPITLGYSTNVEDNDPTWLAIEVPPASISVTIPAGRVELVAGDMQYIAWSSASMDSVKIELSTDNGLTWSAIATVGASPATYIWTVPESISSTECLIRVADLADQTVSDMCDTAFSVFEYRSGDVGGDGQVNIFDLLDLLKVISGVSAESPRSDVNLDGKTDIFDLLELLKKL